MTKRVAVLIGVLASSGAACDLLEDAPPDIEMAPLEVEPYRTPEHDPLERAREELGLVENERANVPSVCWSEAVGDCVACHGRALTAPASASPWKHASEDPRNIVEQMTVFAVVSRIREPNHDAFRSRMTVMSSFAGLFPDVDLRAGFDAAGRARDGSGWRQVRPGALPALSWPDGESMSEVYYRLPGELADAEIAEVNGPDPATVSDGFPVGTEILQVLRYLDPDVRGGASARIKELRTMRKTARVQTSGMVERRLDPLTGIDNGAGWRMQGFIEDGAGRLRLQTDEEQRSCIGCHGADIAVAFDSTFSFSPAFARHLEERPRVYPSRSRALELGKAYLVLVERQRFDLGRTTGLRPRARTAAADGAAAAR